MSAVVENKIALSDEHIRQKYTRVALNYNAIFYCHGRACSSQTSTVFIFIQSSFVTTKTCDYKFKCPQLGMLKICSYL